MKAEVNNNKTRILIIYSFTMSFKKFKLKLAFRVLAVFDVLTSSKFELITYGKDGLKKTTTRFDKQEINNSKI